MKPTFLIRKFSRTAGEFLFISRDRWITDLHLAAALPPEMEVKADALEDSLWYQGESMGCLSSYFESTLSNASPLAAISKPFPLDYPLRFLLIKCRSEDGRTIAVNDFYLRVVKDLWPKARFSLEEYCETNSTNLIARNESGLLMGVIMARYVKYESPEILDKWNSLEMHPIKKEETAND